MNRIIRCISITLVLLIVSTSTLLFILPIPPLLSGMSYSQAVYDSNHQLLRLTLSHDGKYRVLTSLGEMSKELQAATLLQEDQYFHWHMGVNPFSLVRATWQTYLSHHRRLGASTITMQVARIRYGINSKTISGKLMQIVRAMQLEMHYSKNQILEAYLNLAPYGSNIEGAGAASLIYFGKQAKDLSLPEALALTVIPQNPTKRIPDSGKLQEIRHKLYARWIIKYPKDKHKNALMNLPIQMRSVRSMPFLAPHFVNTVLLNDKNSSHQLITTLDYHLQKQIERVTHHYIDRKKNLGVNNAAVLIVDTKDMSVKTLLGSADFFNNSIGGQINGTDIKRSPGSTLKPFIYALAIDQGLIHPGTVLKDVPHSFGSYNPENYDNDFMGPIKAKDALVLSRNIPAIGLAAQLNQPSLYSFLELANVRDLKSESYYGLALVLGGAELSMQELTSLYATLANNGAWRPLRMVQSNPLSVGKPLLSKEASFLVVDMLKYAPEESAANTKHVSLAWKTGTSSGFRDAWTIGFVGRYVVAVWVGNFNNQSNPVFVGKEIAAPLFSEIANVLKTRVGPLTEIYPYPDRMNVKKIDICKASGMLPTRYCTNTEKEWFIPGKSPIKTDTIYREIPVDKLSGLRTCRFDANTRFEIVEFWPSDLLAIFKRAGIARRTPPAFDPTCVHNNPANSGLAPQILSPQTEVSYVARVGSVSETVIPFTAVVDADVRNLFWFLNDSYLGKTTRDQPFLWHAKQGKYVVRIVDEFGRSDARDIIVKAEG